MDNGFNKACPSGNHMIDCRHTEHLHWYCSECDEKISEIVSMENNGLCEECWIDKMSEQERSE
uniref:Uncharacterized protein n=1 Tax=viral metagenome TaxID=1070528 RepID=A0A6H1ZEP3_9ZZZZ